MNNFDYAATKVNEGLLATSIFTYSFHLITIKKEEGILSANFAIRATVCVIDIYLTTFITQTQRLTPYSKALILIYKIAIAEIIHRHCKEDSILDKCVKPISDVPDIHIVEFALYCLTYQSFNYLTLDNAVKAKDYLLSFRKA